MGGHSRAHYVCVLLLFAPFIVFMPTAEAELAGNVAFSEEGITMSPPPVEWGETTFSLDLQNVANVLAENVAVEFHKSNYVNGNPSFATSVNIPANDFLSVDFTWSNLQYGTHNLWIKVCHLGECKLNSTSFDVAGLPNLRFADFHLTPTSGIHQGDQVGIQIHVENAGHADAEATHLELTFAGSANMLSVPALQMGDSVWMNQTGTAPVAGTYEVVGIVNADSNDNVIESMMGDNQENRTLTVDMLPDYVHADGPHVQANPGLAGPWSITGTISRELGAGTTSVPLQIGIHNGMALDISNLQFTDADTFAEYEVVISASQLPDQSPGDTQLDVSIDPANTVDQSNTFNDVATAFLTIHDEPNVVISSVAVATPASITPGLSVQFTVSLQNVGMITVTGTLDATFDGQPLDSQIIIIPAANTGTQGQATATFTAMVSGETRDIPFTATWTKSAESYDRLSTDNVATGFVHLDSDLKIDILQTTENWDLGLPIYSGFQYAYSIDIVATQGSGNVTFVCEDRLRGLKFDEVTLNFQAGQSEELRCIIDTTGIVGDIELAIIPDDGASYAKVWTVENEDEMGTGDETDNRNTTILLFGLAGILGVIVLVGAIIMTRRGLADAEREIYEFCPACDGEIEGDEDTCPYCKFDLSTARNQFHDCPSCNATIPSMMEHCSYCGAEQDLSSHYAPRERTFIALPESESSDDTVEEEDDDDEVVRGSDSFSDHAAEMGFAEEQWEGEWDDKIGEAEAYFDEKEEIKLAIEAQQITSEMDEDAVEETELSQAMEGVPEHDLDAFLGDVESRRHLSDEDVDFSASDAHYREHLFTITGEEGVLPGETVDVESIVDNTVVGNELRSVSSDFTVKDDESMPPAKETSEPEPKSEDDANQTPKRRGVRRRKKGD